VEGGEADEQIIEIEINPLLFSQNPFVKIFLWAGFDNSIERIK